MDTHLRRTINLFSSKTDIRIDPSRTVFWIGAGLSYEAPSNLPLGNKLTDAYLDACLGDRYKNSFVECWNSNIEPLRDIVKQGEVVSLSKTRKRGIDSASGRPRLEFIIGEMNKLDNEFLDFRFNRNENNALFGRKSNIEALHHFAEAEPNIGHKIVAEFANSGAVIVTTNFDVCIEKAIGTSYGNLNNPVIKNGIQSINCDNGVFVYHIHGVATDENIRENLGTTINKVSKPLPDDFKKEMISFFDKGFDILFLGYSGSDYFDVRPFFDELACGGMFSGKAIFLSHCDTPDDVSEALKEKNHIYLQKPFYEQIKICGRTEDFLKELLGEHKTYELIERDLSKVPVITESDFEITGNERVFEETNNDLLALAYDEPVGRKDFYQFLNLFRLCAQLNINPGNIEKHWAEIIADIFKRWESDGKDTIDRMFLQGAINDLVIEDIAYNNWKSKNKVYRDVAKKAFSHRRESEARGKIKLKKYMGKYLRMPPFSLIDYYVDETCKILRKGISNAKEADVCRGTMMYFYSRNISRLFYLWEKIPVLRGWSEKKMKKLLPYYNRLLSFHFARFQYRTHYLYAYRFRNMIHAILRDVEPDVMGLYGDIQLEWNICMESSDLFDARKTMENRLRQIVVLRKRGICIDSNVERNINEVLEALKNIMQGCCMNDECTC